MFLLSSSYAKSRGVHLIIISVHLTIKSDAFFWRYFIPCFSDITVLVTVHPHVNYLLHQPVTKLTWIYLWWFTCSVGKATSKCCVLLTCELDLPPALQSFCVSRNYLCIGAVPQLCHVWSCCRAQFSFSCVFENLWDNKTQVSCLKTLGMNKMC